IRSLAVSGSHATGLATATSDLDWIALVADGRRPSGGRDGEFPDRDYVVRDMLCDVQVVTVNQVRSWTATLAATRPSVTNYGPIFSARRIVRNLVRLVMAEPWYGEGEFE